MPDAQHFRTKVTEHSVDNEFNVNYERDVSRALIELTFTNLLFIMWHDFKRDDQVWTQPIETESMFRT